MYNVSNRKIKKVLYNTGITANFLDQLHNTTSSIHHYTELIETRLTSSCQNCAMLNRE